MSTEIIEGNKLIAEFMGWVVMYQKCCRLPFLTKEELVGIGKGYVITEHWGLKEDFEDRNEEDVFEPFQLLYHSSWDWQIPTWGKIALAVKTLLADKKYSHMDVDAYLKKVEKYDNAVFQNKPEDGQKIIVELIKWYQNQILNNTITHGC